MKSKLKIVYDKNKPFASSLMRDERCIGYVHPQSQN